MKTNMQRWSLIASFLAFYNINAQREETYRPSDAETREFATAAIYRTVEPLIIPRDRRIDVGTDGRDAEAALPGADPIYLKMYEAMDLVLDDEFEEAIPLLEQVLSKEPTIVPVWSTLGWTYWRVGRQDDAIRLWKQFLELDANHPEAHALVGNAFIGTGRLRQAEYHLSHSIELNPDQIEPKIALSSLYRWTGRHQASVDLLRSVLKDYPDRMDIQNELGLSLFETGHYDEALPYLRRAARALPDDPNIARAYVRCLLRTGDLVQAQLYARRMMRSDNAGMSQLLLLADAPRLQNNPEGALPYLRRIIEIADEDHVRIEAHNRLIEVGVRLWERDPRSYSLREAVNSARELLDIDPDNPHWRQTYGELLLREHRYTDATRQFERIIDGATTNVLAARSGLFEVGQASNNYRMGKKHLDFIESVNPLNPYLHVMRARLEMSRGNMKDAYASLDQLEAAGSRGAVAVLHYYTLSDSDWAEALSARRFRLQMLALKQAGYRFLKPGEIADYFHEINSSLSGRKEDILQSKAVVITFDQPDARTLQLATEVADDLDLVFALHVPSAPLKRRDSGFVSIDELSPFLQSGRWALGSMLHDAVVPKTVRPDDREGSVLANRVWLNDDDMYEPYSVFNRRLQNEYRQSRAYLREWFGDEHLVNFVAYPYNEYGQGLISNVEDAIQRNIHEAAINYEVGFVGTVYGYAVNGDNPLLYQRYSPAFFDEGQDIIEHFAKNHPVFMARRMRAEFAALDGRAYRAMKALDQLKEDGYPQRLYTETEAFVYHRLALKFGVARQTEPTYKDMFELDLQKPYLGIGFESFRDSLNRRNWRTTGHAGFYITPVLNVEGRGGYGQYRQRYTLNLAEEDETPQLEQRRAYVSESFAGVRLGFRYDPAKSTRSPVTFAAGLERHLYRDDADFNDWAYMLEAAFRPWFFYDILLRFEHDGMPSARSLTEEVTYDQYLYAGALRVRDWWDIWTQVSYYDIAFGNDRLHASISSMWELSERAGVHAGAEYGYVDAKHAKDDYWTPYRLRQWGLIAQWRNNFYRFYYDLSLRYGYSRERIRPEDKAAYERLVERAREFLFDPGDRPSSEWVSTFGASASLRWYFGRYWYAYLLGLYSESANYHESNVAGGLSLEF